VALASSTALSLTDLTLNLNIAGQSAPAGAIVVLTLPA
jgi:hypothetical protein